MSIKPIEVVIRAKDETTSILGSLQAKMTALAAAVTGFFGLSTLRSAADFEASLSRVKAATDATAEEMAALKHAAEEAGASTKYTSAEAAQALENLAKAGLSAKDSVAALPAVLALAQAGDVQLGQAAEFVTKAVMGMGLAFTDAGRVADVLAMGANASNTSVRGLAEALSYAAPVAHSLGLGLETTVAIIGKFADSGIDASRAGTALNSVLSQFSDPASKFRDSLAAIGITTNNFEQALRQLAAAGPKGASAILAVGQEAGPALRALLNQGIGSLDDLKHKLDDSAGSAARTAAIMEDNLHGALNSLASAWDTVKDALGTPVLPVLKDAVNQFASSLRALVSDGTIGKFGASIAEAFRSGIQWSQAFLEKIDFSTVVKSMQDFATHASEIFAKVGEYASTAGDSVKLAYGVMAGGVNAVLVGIYAIGSGFSEVASVVMQGVGKLRDGLATVTFGGLSESFRVAAEDARNMAEAFGAAAQAMRDKARSSLDDVADAAQMARDGFEGLSNASNKVSSASAEADASIKVLAASIEAGGTTAEAAGQKQSKAAQDASSAVAAQTARVKELREQYEQQISLGNLQAAADVLQQIDKTQRAVAVSAELSSKQIEAQAKAMAARNTVAAAGLNLELAQERAYEATAQAAGNELGVLNSKIRQKEIEIKVVQATAKAMTDEADAAIKVAETKLRELQANKEVNPELEAELRNRIELGKARRLEAEATEVGTAKLQAEIAMLRNGNEARNLNTSATLRSAQARDAATAALERENEAQERAISAQEKANQLKERELELYRQRMNIDKEGYSLNTAGERVQMLANTEASVFNQAKSAGLDEAVALRVAGMFRYDQNGYNADASAVNKAINDAILAAARERVRDAGGQAQATTNSGTNGSNSTSTSSASSTGGPYVNNLTLYVDGGVVRTTTRHADAQSAQAEVDFLKRLSDAKGRAA